MLAIIDYGAGNLRNVFMAFRRLGVEATLTDDSREIARASALVLPGVGSFGDAMVNLRSRHLEDTIVEAIQDGVPFLGICIGMQVLFEVGEEMGEHRGLGVVPGRVRRFSSDVTVPHMGWNQIHQAKATPLWDGVPDGSYAYFVHSYYCETPDEDLVAARTDYDRGFVSAIARGNMAAIQFHPEKSQDVGERILANFVAMAGLEAR
ncbi:MAG: imidazole glycerol phosphate synthase subunit HisH [Anaerolineae bacterium]